MDTPEFSLSDDSLLEHASWLRKLAQELVRDPATAEDLAQDTWLAFFRVRPDTDRPVRPWLARVARNAAMRRARNRRGRAAREKEVAREEHTPSEEELLERAEQQQRLARAVLELPEPYRRALLLRYYEGLTPSQIARAIKVPPATVRTHLHRGLELLRAQLDKEHGGDRHAWIVMLQPILHASDPSWKLSTTGLATVAMFATIAITAWFQWSNGTQEKDPAHLASVADADEESRSPLTAQLDYSGQRTDDLPTTLQTTEGTRVIVLEDQHGIPLAGFAVRPIVDRTDEAQLDSRELVSDSEGRIHIPANAERLVPFDQTRLATDERRSHGPSKLRPASPTPVPIEDRIRVTTGPAFRLAVHAQVPVDLERFTARLSVVEPESAVRVDQLAPVRAPGFGFDRPWVRFADAPIAGDEPGSLWSLELTDEGGLARGATRIAPEDAHGHLINVEVHPTGVIEGHLGGVSQDALGGVLVTLRATGGSARGSFQSKLDEFARYAMRWIPPGEYELRVQSTQHVTESRAVTVRAGERMSVDLTLDPKISVGPLAGVITSESKSYSGQLLVFLNDAQGGLVDIYPTTWKRDESGNLTTTFRFESVPPGALQLDVLSLADRVTFETTPLQIEGPNESVSVLLLDEKPAADWKFDVVDDATGDELERYEVEVRIDDGPPRRFVCGGPSPEDEATKIWTLIAGDLRWNRFESRAPLVRLPKDARISWTVRVEGHVPVRGTEADFDWTGAGVLVAEVRVRPQ